MGSSPKTKAEYREKIARKQGELERAKAAAQQYKSLDWKNRVVSLKSEIAELKAKMANAPK